jgi:hypothetical protein
MLKKVSGVSIGKKVVPLKITPESEVFEITG